MIWAIHWFIREGELVICFYKYFQDTGWRKSNLFWCYFLSKRTFYLWGMWYWNVNQVIYDTSKIFGLMYTQYAIVGVKFLSCVTMSMGCGLPIVYRDQVQLGEHITESLRLLYLGSFFSNRWRGVALLHTLWNCAGFRFKIM